MRLNSLLKGLIGRKQSLAIAFSTFAFLLFAATASICAAAGDLDATFGNGGKVFLLATTNVSVTGLNKAIVQPDGKILGIGLVRVGNPPGHTYRTGLVRLNADGTPDNTFGNGGNMLPEQVVSTYFCVFALQADGKIVLACIGTTTTFQGVVIHRYNSDGTPDTGFGMDGVALTNLGGSIGSADIIVQPDGKILFGGGISINGAYSRFVLTRYNPNGSPDASFGANGVVLAPANPNRSDGLATLLLQPDGKIIATGSTNTFSVILFRYHANGTLDGSFGTNGEVITQGSRGGKSLLRPDGKIVLSAGGAASTQILQYNSNGTLDAAFGNGGVAIPPLGNGLMRSFTLQPDGKIVLGGYTSTGTAEANILAARLHSNGQLDTSFGTGGIVTTDFEAPGGSYGNDVTLQPDGKILVVGINTHDKYSNNPVLVRYLNSIGARDFDFDGDGKADVSIFRPNSSAEWYWLNSSNNQSSGIQFGISADKPAASDYDGDGKTDIAVFRDGDWYRLNSSNNSFVAVHFGQSGDVPVPADYDGDDKADLAVYRAGNWYVLNSADNSFRAEQFGIASDKPVIGDFDGDGKNDLAVYRASEGIWYVQRSRDGFFGVQFGISSDKPVAADYDGDGKTDVAVFRPSDGVWYLLRSNLGFTATQFGASTDKPAPADYDGDGKTDLAVYRDGDWYLLRSQQGFAATQFGTAGDRPVPNSFVP